MTCLFGCCLMYCLMSVSTVVPSSGRPLRSVDGTGRKKVAVPSRRNRSHCLFVPLHFRSWERKDHRENFRSRVELSFHGTFAPWNFRSCGTFRSSGANVPRTFVPMKLYYHENEYFTNFRYKTRPINLKIAYVHQSPAVNNFQQLICRQCSAGAKPLG